VGVADDVDEDDDGSMPETVGASLEKEESYS
jgi:hypothetical protein